MGYKDLQNFNNKQFSDSPTTTGSKTPVVVPQPKLVSYRDRDLGDRPTYNAFKDTAGDYLNAEYNQAVFNPFASDYFNAKFMGMDFGKVTDALENTIDGIDPYSKSVDFEHLRRNSQGKISAAAGLAGQFVGKTAVNTVGGIVGGFYSLGAAAVNGDSSLLFDNSVNRTLDKASEWVDENNSVFTSQAGRQNAPLGLFSIEGVKDVGDAYSFIAGAVASELIVDGLSFGIGAAGLPARLTRLAGSAYGKSKASIGLGRNLQKTGNYISRSEEVAKLFTSVDLDDVKRLESLGQQFGVTVDDIVKTKKAMDKANEIALRGRKLITGTFWEGGLEARQTKDAIIEEKEKDLQASLEVMDFGSQEEKDKFEADERQKIKDVADTAGFVTFGLNAGLLNASNIVQFPTIFGRGAVKDLNKNASRVGRAGLGKVVEKNSKMDLLRTFGVALKASGTEFLEETGQGLIGASAKNYYETSLGTRTATGELMPGTASIADSLLLGLEQAYGTKEGLHEGMIGAIVGAMGLPMIKKNKKGKYRSLEFTGGIAEAIRDSKSRKKEYEKVVEAAKMNEFGQLLTYSKDNAILSAIDGKKLDMAALDGDVSAEDDIKNNMIFRYVNSKLDAGIEGHIAEDISELEKMSVEEYSKVYNRNGESSLEEGQLPDPNTALTQEQKDKEVNDFKRKTEVYSQAYKTVYSGLRMDRIQDNFASKKLFNTLVHSLSNEKLYRARQLELVDELLKRKDIDMSKEDLLKLASLDGKFKGQKQQVQDYLDELQKEKNEEFEAKLGKYKADIDNLYSLAENESDRKLLSKLYEESSDSDWTEKYLNLMASKADGFKSEEFNKLARKAPEYIDSRKKMKDAAKALEIQEKRRAKDTKIDKRTKPYKEYKTRKEALKGILEEIALSKKAESSATLNTLRGKEDKITQSDLREYFDLKAKVAGMKLDENVDESMLDALEASNKDENKKSFNDIMEDLSEISRKQVLAMEIASNLYDQSNPSSGYNKILNAIFLEDLSNLEKYNALTDVLIVASDDEAVSEILGMMQVAVKNVEKNLDEEKEGLSKETIEKLDKIIKETNKNISKIKEAVGIIDAESDAVADTLNQRAKDAEGDLNKAFIAKDTAERAEAQAIADEKAGKVAKDDRPTWTIRGSKNSKVKDVIDFNEKLESGEIKYNSAARLSTNEDMEDAEFNKYLDSLGAKDLYYKGKEMIKSDKTILDSPTEDYSPEVMTYITHKPIRVKFYDAIVEYIEDEQISGITEDSNVLAEMFLFSPDLSKEDSKAISDEYSPKYKEAKLEYDSKVVSLTAEYEASSKTDEDLAKFKKNESKAKKVWETQKETLRVSRLSRMENANDKAVFNLRKEIIQNEGTPNEGTLDLRVSNINEGRLERSTDTNFDVEENGLVTATDNPDGLVADKNDINEEDILIGTQTGEFIDMKGDKVILNTSSVLKNTKSINSRLYFVYKTVNGQRIPVLLNRSKLGKNKELLDEIMHQIKEFLINKRPTDKIKVKNEKFKFLEGNSSIESKTFEEFFRTFFDKNNSGPREDKTLATLDIDKKNLVLFLGNMNESLTDVKQLEDNFDKIREALGNMRYYLDKNSFSKNDGSFNREMFDFILDNKMINHSFNASKNRDKVFIQEKDFNKSIGVHSLNYKGTVKAKEVKASRTDKVTEEVYATFGLTTKTVKSTKVKDRPNLTLNRAYWLFNEKVIALTNAKVKENFGIKDPKDRPTLVIEAFNEAMEDYLKTIDDLAKLAPHLYTEGAKERIFTGKDSKEDNKFLDNTYRIAKHYVDKVKGSKDFMEVILSISESGNYDIDYKKNLVNPENPVISLGSSEFGQIYNKGDVNKRGEGNGLVFSMPEALTEGNKNENERKTKNLIKSFVLLKESIKIFHPKNYEKHGYRKDDKSNRKYIFFDHTIKYFNKGKTVTTAYRNTVDATGITATNYKESTGAGSLFHSDKNESIQFYIEDADGEYELTNTPEQDFKFDENGVLLNGVITVSVTSTMKTQGAEKTVGSRKVAFSGTSNNPNGVPGVNTLVGFISEMRLPGLTADFEINQQAVDSLEGKMIKFKNNYSRLNQATAEKSPLKKDLHKKVDIQDEASEQSEVDALGDLLFSNMGIKPKKEPDPIVTNDVPTTNVEEDPNPFSSLAPDPGSMAGDLANMFSGITPEPKDNSTKIVSGKLSIDDINLIQADKSFVIANISDYEAAFDTGSISADELEKMLYKTLEEYKITNYETFIEAIQYVFINNEDGLKKTINFVNKLKGSNLTKDDFNDCLK